MGLAEEILKRVGSSKELMKSVAHALKGKTNSPDHLSNSIDTAYQVVGMSMVLAGVDRLENKINGTNY